MCIVYTYYCSITKGHETFMHLWWLVVVLILHGIRKANFYSSTPPTSIDFQSLHFAVCKHAKLHQKLGFVLMLYHYYY